MSHWNCRISNDLDALERLNRRHPWMPGRDNVRPTPEVRAAKEKYLVEVATLYASEGDFILNTIFDLPLATDADGKLYVPLRANLPRLRRFVNNLYPYVLPHGTVHSVMWYTYGPDGLSDEQISQDIAADLGAQLGGVPLVAANAVGTGAPPPHAHVASTTNSTHGVAPFEFVWYENPKMSIPDIYHVQVFWHSR
eukprot:gnl/Spiro4/11098_TR5885_c0_g1_i1.p2 gnl/Spiro4/11098_TR5885_c0_g1~~gnl/Spiro4/11098_TR5885_c0_g1_i1.p2  ORF type:complete len:207 (-),score=48.24 gnl/Spiro4/11098_TR5885_c0_g1_i1:102-686(-)